MHEKLLFDHAGGSGRIYSMPILSGVLATILCSLLVIGCKGNVSSGNASIVNTQTQRAIVNYDSQEDFPTCNDQTKNNLVYSTTDHAIFTCTGSAYVQINVAASSTTSSTSTTPAAPSGIAALAQHCPNAVDTIPKPSDLNGQLLLNLPSDTDPCSATGFVVGQQNTLPLNLSKSGQFFINNVPPGQNDIIVTAGSLNVISLALAAATVDRGIRMNQVTAVTGIATAIGDIQLEKFGSISGKVTLSASAGVSDYAGILIYIPGTSYSALSNTDGTYVLTNIPPGVHNLFYEKDGFDRGQVESIEVHSAQNTTLDDLALGLQTIENGSFNVINKFTASTGQSIIAATSTSMMMIPPSDGVLMMVKDSYGEGLWKPITTNYTFNFDIPAIAASVGGGNGYVQSPFANNMNVKYANANGLETDVITKNFYLDLFSNGTSYFTPQYNVTVTTSPLALSFTNIANPTQADKVSYYYASGYAPYSAPANPVFEPLATQKTVTLADKFSNCGVFYTYLFYSGYQGRVRFLSVNDPLSSSSVPISLAKTALNKCYTEVTSTDAPVMRRMSGTNSDSYYAAVWTGTEVVVVGFDGNNDLTMGRYNPTTQQWSTSTSTTGIYAPTMRKNFQLLYTGHYVFLIFGQDTSNSQKNDMFAYDLTSNSWINPSPTSTPDLSAYTYNAIASDGRYLIIFHSNGTWNGTQNDLTYRLYDSQALPAGEPWASPKIMTGVANISNFGILPAAGKMFITGGNINSGSTYGTNSASYLFDYLAGTLTAKASLPANTVVRYSQNLSQYTANVDPDASNLLHFFTNYQSDYALTYNVNTDSWTVGNIGGGYAPYPQYGPVMLGNELIMLNSGTTAGAYNLTTGANQYGSFGDTSYGSSSTPLLWAVQNPDLVFMIPALKQAFIWGGSYTYYMGNTQYYNDYSSGIMLNLIHPDNWTP